MAQIKFYRDVNQVWVYTDGISDSEQTVNSPCRRVINGTKVGVFSSLSNYSLFREPNELIEVTDIQKSATPGDNYADVNEFIAATVDFFVNASGGGGTGDIGGTISLNTIPIGVGLDTIGNSSITYNTTLDRYESTKEFYATKLSSEPGTLELGNLSIDSSNHGIGIRNIGDGQKSIVLAQRYDETGTEIPEALNFGAQQEVPRQTLFNEGQPSVPYSYSFTFGPTERVLWTGLVLKPEEEGIFVFTMRANDANGPIITTQNDFVFTSGDIGNDIIVPLSNDFQLLPNETVHITLEGAKVLGGTPVSEWIPYFKAIETNVISFPIDSYPQSTTLSEGGTISINTSTTIDIAAGSGKINGGYIFWDSFIGISLPDIAIRESTRIGIDLNGTPVQLPFDLTTQFTRDYITLGYVVHPNSQITKIVNDVLKDEELYSQFVDCLEVHGVERKSGLAISPNAGLTMVKTAGELQAVGAGVNSGNAGQNIVAIAADSPATFSRILGLTSTLEAASTDIIDPGFYDDGSGTKVALAQPNNASIQYIYQGIDSQDSLFVVYGQKEYPDIETAINNQFTDIQQLPVEIQTRTNLIARIALRRDCTNLSDTNQAQVLSGVKFGVGLFGVGFGTVSGGGDVFGPADSIIDEIATYADGSGKVIRSGRVQAYGVGADLARVVATQRNLDISKAVGRNVTLGGLLFNDNGTFLGAGDTLTRQGVIQSNKKASDTDNFTKDTGCPLVSNLTVDNGGNTPAASEPVFIAMRPGVPQQAFGNILRMDLSRYENDGANSRTKLDFRLSHGSGITEGNNPPIIMSLKSDGSILDKDGNPIGNTPKDELIISTVGNGTITILGSADVYTDMVIGNAINTHKNSGNWTPSTSTIQRLNSSWTGLIRCSIFVRPQNIGTDERIYDLRAYIGNTEIGQWVQAYYIKPGEPRQLTITNYATLNDGDLFRIKIKQVGGITDAYPIAQSIFYEFLEA